MDSVALNIQLALAALAAGIGIGILGAKSVESIGRNPSAFGKILMLSIVFAALIEGVFIMTLFLGKK